MLYKEMIMDCFKGASDYVHSLELRDSVKVSTALGKNFYLRIKPITKALEGL